MPPSFLRPLPHARGFSCTPIPSAADELANKKEELAAAAGITVAILADFSELNLSRTTRSASRRATAATRRPSPRSRPCCGRRARASREPEPVNPHRVSKSCTPGQCSSLYYSFSHPLTRCASRWSAAPSTSSRCETPSAAPTQRTPRAAAPAAVRRAAAGTRAPAPRTRCSAAPS